MEKRISKKFKSNSKAVTTGKTTKGEVRDYIVYTLGLGSRNGYNESTDKFEWLSAENATKYTVQEAKAKRDELLKPLVQRYQDTGKPYVEIHYGKISKI